MNLPTEAPRLPRPTPSSLGGIFDMFREGTGLVEAAAAALAGISDDLGQIRTSICASVDPAMVAVALASMRAHIESATVAGDNLLVADPRHGRTGALLVRALARDSAGNVTIRDIAIERGALAMIGDPIDDTRPFDRLDRACHAARVEPETAAAIVPALEAMAAHVAAATSRLSIVKARLALQSSFLAAVADADVAPIVDSQLDLSDARDLALRTRQLLSGQALDIGNSNRQTLQALFARP